MSELRLDSSTYSDNELANSGASSPTTGEFVVVTSAVPDPPSDIGAVQEASTSEAAKSEPQNNETQTNIVDSSSEPSTTEDTSVKNDSSAEVEEKPLKYHYECKFLEERYIAGSWETIEAGTAPPPDPPSSSGSGEYSNYPLCLITEYRSSGKFRDRKLQVKSDALKRVIRRCLGDRDAAWKVDEDDDVECSWPWEPWVKGLKCFKAEKTRLEGLIDKNGGKKDNTNKDWEEMMTCGVLIETLETYHASTIRAMKEITSKGFVTYANLWTVYETYQELYMFDKDTQKHRCYEFKSGEYETSDGSPAAFKIIHRHVDYDGTNFGWVDKCTQISEFRGRKKISSLPIFPLLYHPNKEAIREELLATGRKFESMKGTHYMRYGPPIKPGEVEGVSQRMMVDMAEYEKAPSLDEVIEPKEQSELEVLHALKAGGYLVPSDNAEDTEQGSEADEVYCDDKSRIPLDDCFLLLTNNCVGAFNFNTKQWAAVDVNQLSPPTWNQNAFDLLVLDEARKDLVRALMEQHIEDSSAQETTFDDIIPGKGKGLVYVLHGPPGVGKTLTAEAVSEYIKSPLYSVSAGQLGTTPDAMERDLNRIFDLAARWNAVVLIDEADVFMEARGLHEIERNAIVSVFLKALEYYKGIIFLTTNRVKSFDDAFKSRIHIALRLSELDLPTRTKIWQTFINRLRASASGRKVDLTDEDVLKLAEREVNGREIKNAIKSAQGLARRKGENLNVQHLTQVLEIQGSFLGDT